MPANSRCDLIRAFKG